MRSWDLYRILDFDQIPWNLNNFMVSHYAEVLDSDDIAQ